ncbi:MAG TPA: hypothetical protein VFE24_13540, partial [Pirellulales bacterium]|nr:hypothetical protein [Pirellulales bacterium]
MRRFFPHLSMGLCALMWLAASAPVWAEDKAPVEKGPVQKELEKRAAEEKKVDKDKPPVPLAIAEIKHPNPVDFEKEILPVLRRNCQACHNTKDKENDLVL